MMSDLNQTIDELNTDITNLNAEQDTQDQSITNINVALDNMNTGQTTQDQNIANMAQDIANLAGTFSQLYHGLIMNIGYIFN